MITHSANRAHQTGVVLVIGLMLLLIVTIVGVTAVQNTAFDERMASNVRAQQIAFQAAEGAMQQGLDVNNKKSLFTTADIDKNNDNCATWSGAICSGNACYVLQRLEGQCNTNQGRSAAEHAPSQSLYRVTSCAQVNNSTTVVLEMTECSF